MSFNLEQLKKLVSDDKDAQISFVSLFISEIEGNEIPQILSSLESKDVSTLKNKAHAIKSNVKFFGYNGLSSRLNELEKKLVSRESLNSELVNDVKHCVQELQVACDELKNWKNKQ